MMQTLRNSCGQTPKIGSPVLELKRPDFSVVLQNDKLFIYSLAWTGICE